MPNPLMKRDYEGAPLGKLPLSAGKLPPGGLGGHGLFDRSPFVDTSLYRSAMAAMSAFGRFGDHRFFFLTPRGE
jgi:hypothetical protein